MNEPSIRNLHAIERALDESENRFRLLVEGTKEYAIFMLDEHGHILSWNAGARRLKGYTEEEIRGRHFSIFYTEPDLADGKPARELQIARTEGKYEEEGWRVRKDGTTFWANVVITALYDADGQLKGFGKVTRDLSERRRIDEALRHSEAQYRLLVSSVKDYAIFMLGPDGRVQTWNAGAERIKGYKASEIIGQHFSVFYPPEEIEAGKPVVEIDTAIRTGRWEEEGWRLRRDGTRFWAGVVLTAIRDETGELRGFAKVTRDLTERRRLELDLLHKNAALEAALLAKDRFLASMSHELRTPLNAILGYTGTLLMRLPGPLNEEQDEQLNIVKSSARHLLSLINDLLDLAKLNAGKVELNIEPVDCQQLLDEIATTLRPLATERGLAFEVLPAERTHVLRADRRALQQILLNLGNNALKFTREGRVELSFGVEANGELAIRVRDTGIGIRDEDKERLFQPFVRLEEFADGPTGSGLGLHVSQILAKSIGGRIEVESEFGCGSCFTLVLRGG